MFPPQNNIFAQAAKVFKWFRFPVSFKKSLGIKNAKSHRVCTTFANPSSVLGSSTTTRSAAPSPDVPFSPRARRHSVPSLVFGSDLAHPSSPLISFRKAGLRGPARLVRASQEKCVPCCRNGRWQEFAAQTSVQGEDKSASSLPGK